MTLIIMIISLSLLLLSSYVMSATSSGVTPDYGLQQPVGVSDDDWNTALELFDAELHDSSNSLLTARHRGLPSWTGVPCRTVNNNGLQCEADDNLSATNATRDCVFLHGSGERADGAVTNTFPGYWGTIENFTPQCRTRTFIHANTLTRSWYNYTIMRVSSVMSSIPLSFHRPHSYRLCQ
jgi:hypothetical protein